MLELSQNYAIPNLILSTTYCKYLLLLLSFGVKSKQIKNIGRNVVSTGILGTGVIGNVDSEYDIVNNM